MEKLKFSTVNMVDVHDWNILVQSVYSKPYDFQQQDGCQDRGIKYITIPSEDDDLNVNENIPFKINAEVRGVRFSTWLNTSVEDINAKNPEEWPGANNLFWERNFYPDLQTVANDLHKKGLIDAGDYIINIDW